MTCYGAEGPAMGQKDPAMGLWTTAPDPTSVALELQGLSLEDEAERRGEGRAQPHRSGVPAPQVAAPPALEGEGPAVTSAGAAVTSETMTSEAAVTSGGQLMFSRRTDRRLILLGQRDPPCVLALRSSVQGAIGLQRASSLPRRRGERGGSPPAPRPRSHHGQGVLALQLDPESYSTCLHLAELQRRVREALAERERLLRAREAAKAPPPPVPAPPPPEAIEEVYYGHGRVACKSPNPRLTFCLKTYDRLFCLVAPSPEAMRIWMDAVLTATQWAGPP